jgi:hypothetical protein
LTSERVTVATIVTPTKPKQRCAFSGVDPPNLGVYSNAI